MRKDIIQNKENILKWIESSQSKSFICKQLNCKPVTLESYLIKMGISYSGNKGLKGVKKDLGYVKAEEYIKGKHVSAHKLRLKLLKEGIKEHKCEICGITEWMGKQAPLELDHIDGNHYNNSMSNIRIICPNCHSLTETNSGKKNKRPRD